MNARCVPAFLAALLCCGCTSYGAARLDHDQVDYAQALAWSKKRQTLANIVNLRYADSPSFLTVTQIIAGYSQTTSATGTLNAAGAGTPASSAQLGGTFSFANNPTFTFSPTTGEAFAAGYIRPLSPATVLPLAQSGVPIDLLMRISLQSIGGLRNSAALSGQDSAGSPGFFELIHALRRLQLAGALSVRYASENGAGHVYLDIGAQPESSKAIRDDVRRVQALLHVKAPEVEVVYGATPPRGAAVDVITRSVLGILSEIGAQVDVSDADVAANAALPTVKLVGESRPIIVVRVGDAPPAAAFVDVAYAGHHYWIESSDFDSKYAFSVVQNLIALAEVTDNSKTPIVTIPAQ